MEYINKKITLEEAIKENVDHILKWLVCNQNKDGGFPPYPQHLDDSGVVTTSLVLDSLINAYVKKDKNLNSKFFECYDGEYVKLSKSISSGVKFILDYQLKDGSFPPAGDIFWIFEGFPEATAKAVSTLFNYKFLINEYTKTLYEKEDAFLKEIKNIDYAILLGITFLKKNKVQSNKFVIWETHENSLDYRMYPTILSLYTLAEFEENKNQFTISHDYSFEETLKIGTEFCIKLLSTNGYIPMKFNGKKESVTNTILALKLLDKIDENLIDLKSKEDAKIYTTKYLHSVKNDLISNKDISNPENENIEFDDLKLKIGESCPSSYTIPRRKDIILASYIKDKELVQTLISLEFEKNKDYLEIFRCKIVPSTKETALYLNILFQNSKI